jgi:uncharacterized lipoprotein YmbA
MKDKTNSGKWLFLACLMMLSGCGAGSAPSDFYMMKPMATGPSSEQSGLKDVVVGVGPASFPEYLNRPQIITRESAIKIRINEFQRWAGSLQGDFLQVLAENLSLLLGSDKVVAHPWGDYFEVGYKVPLDVQQFDGSPGEAVFLNVQWAVLSSDDKVLVTRKSAIKTEVNGADYDALVLAQSQALVELSKEIAAQIRKVATNK